MKQQKKIERVISNIYDKLVIEKKNNSQKQMISGAEFLKLIQSGEINKSKKIVVLLADADVISPDRKILVGDYEENKNLRSLC